MRCSHSFGYAIWASKMNNKKKEIDITKIKPEETMKYEIAKELGLFDQVLKDGWGSLSAKETGRIGGLITKKRKALEKIENER